MKLKRYTMEFVPVEETEAPVWTVRDEDDYLVRVFRTDREAALFIKENLHLGKALELK